MAVLFVYIPDENSDVTDSGLLKIETEKQF